MLKQSYHQFENKVCSFLQIYVRWKFGNIVLTDSESEQERKYVFSDNDGQGKGVSDFSLRVNNVGRYDQGTYSCNAHVGNEEEDRQYILDLNYREFQMNNNTTTQNTMNTRWITMHNVNKNCTLIPFSVLSVSFPNVSPFCR